MTIKQGPVSTSLTRLTGSTQWTDYYLVAMWHSLPLDTLSQCSLSAYFLHFPVRVNCSAAKNDHNIQEVGPVFQVQAGDGQKKDITHTKPQAY